MAEHWQVGSHSLIGAAQACQAVKAAIKITSRTSSDAGHMAASLTRTNCTSSQLPARPGSILSPAFLFFLSAFFPPGFPSHVSGPCGLAPDKSIVSALPVSTGQWINCVLLSSTMLRYTLTMCCHVPQTMAALTYLTTNAGILGGNWGHIDGLGLFSAFPSFTVLLIFIQLKTLISTVT